MRPWRQRSSIDPKIFPFSLAALLDFYGRKWASWILQKLNLDCRLPHFGLEVRARRLVIPRRRTAPAPETSKLFWVD